MGHYAKIDKNIVQEVIVAKKEFFENFIDTTPGEWLKCSYNTLNNKHNLDGEPLRGNFPSIGYEYNKKLDIFLPKKPFNSWIIDEENAKYKAPKDKPEDGKDYFWSEEDLDWVEREDKK